MNPFLSANADRHFKLFGAVVLTAAVLSGCTAQAAGNAKDPKPAAQAEQIKTVKVTGVTKQKIGDPLEQIADVVSSIQMDIVAKSGGDVQQILKKNAEIPCRKARSSSGWIRPMLRCRRRRPNWG